ncbi:MAG: hypothetical protein JXR97_07430, partial [Planctomycetes bacterium]|nr:hypothetical protein [Planctomycetota bacterium]
MEDPAELFDFPNIGLRVTRRIFEDCVRLTFNLKSTDNLLLHWGLNRGTMSAWCAAPEELWPTGTVLFNAQAAQTPFSTGKMRQITISLPSPLYWQGLSFVLLEPETQRWIKNDRRDFFIPLPGEQLPSPRDVLLRQPEAEKYTSSHELTLDGGMRLAVGRRDSEEQVDITLACDAVEPVLLHWGMAGKFRRQWVLPPEQIWPAGTQAYDELSVETPFEKRGNLYWLEMSFYKPSGDKELHGLLGVLHLPGSKSWIKAGEDLYFPLFAETRNSPFTDPLLVEISDTILAAEVGKSSWTLMHRINLCHDLLDSASGHPEALALLFVWLRYSAIRQLDWQRNYNTKPRDLAHAMERLTLKLARLWRSARTGRNWLRLMLGTLGRGGDGQRVRDEILHIMHRNGIKEVSGLFLEEWHQKLHNNTTSDDVVICEAYLAFLESNGNTAAFYDTLGRSGVTRQRLTEFERPIRTDPQFWPEKRDSLISEFRNYLDILKSVHSGTDLQVSINAARHCFSSTLSARVDHLMATRNGGGRPAEIMRLLVETRAELRQMLNESTEEYALRELLFLDLALEELPRTELGRIDLPSATPGEYLDLITPLIDHVGQSIKAEEFVCTERHWDKISAMRSESADWALQAKSVTDRLGRLIQSYSDELYAAMQSKAEYLGRECGVEEWAIQIFSEEIIRGTATFGLAQLLRHLDPRLREQAGLRGWQIVSPASAFGTVAVVESLIAAQGVSFPDETVIITDRV